MLLALLITIFAIAITENVKPFIRGADDVGSVMMQYQILLTLLAGLVISAGIDQSSKYTAIVTMVLVAVTVIATLVQVAAALYPWCSRRYKTNKWRMKRRGRKEFWRVFFGLPDHPMTCGKRRKPAGSNRKVSPAHLSGRNLLASPTASELAMGTTPSAVSVHGVVSPSGSAAGEPETKAEALAPTAEGGAEAAKEGAAELASAPAPDIIDVDGAASAAETTVEDLDSLNPAGDAAAEAAQKDVAL